MKLWQWYLYRVSDKIWVVCFKILIRFICWGIFCGVEFIHQKILKDLVNCWISNGNCGGFRFLFKFVKRVNSLFGLIPQMSGHGSGMECLKGEGENDKPLLSNSSSTLVKVRSVRLITMSNLWVKLFYLFYLCVAFLFVNDKELSFISARLGSIIKV